MDIVEFLNPSLFWVDTFCCRLLYLQIRLLAFDRFRHVVKSRMHDLSLQFQGPIFCYDQLVCFVSCQFLAIPSCLGNKFDCGSNCRFWWTIRHDLINFRTIFLIDNLDTNSFWDALMHTTIPSLTKNGKKVGLKLADSQVNYGWQLDRITHY